MADSIQNCHSSLLDDVMEFNNGLIALANAGFPVAESLHVGRSQLQQLLDNFTLDVATAVCRSPSDNDLIGRQTHWPTHYRNALFMWIQSNRSYESYEPLLSTTEVGQRLRSHTIQAFVPVLIIALMAYLGAIYLALVIEPKLISFYKGNGLSPGFAMGLLTTISRLLPFWIILVPISILVIGILVVQWKWKISSREQQVENSACRAADLANQCVQADWNLKSVSTQVTAEAAVVPIPAPTNDAPVAAIDSLYSWAVSSHSQPSEQSVRLAVAVKTYRLLAKKKLDDSRIGKSVFWGVFVGGSIVLIYCLSFFGPFAETILKLCRL